MPFKTAWTLPELDGIGFMAFQETAKIRKNGSWLNLVRVGRQFEDFSSFMDRISNNNNFGHIIKIWCLVDATSDNKEFCFSACNMNHMVDHLYNWSVIHVHIVKIVDGRLYFILSFHFILLYFYFYFLFLEQLGLGFISHAVTSVTNWWCKSQDWSWDLKEWSRKFWNKVMLYSIDNTCWPHVILMVI